MAWVGSETHGRWVEREERQGMIDTYTEYKELMDERYPDIDDMVTDGVAEEYLGMREELARLERVKRCEGNLLEFAIEYFSESWNPDNAGNWDGFHIKYADEAPEFHKELTGIMDNVATTERNAKVATAVARSHGKSTWLSKAFPVSEIAYRSRKYIIIISETPSVSTANMTWIRDQIKGNQKLREDFGPLLSPRDQSNVVDNSEEFIAWAPDGEGNREQLTMVQAASTGQALRGRNWDGSRPDLVIMDDLEDARSGGNASTEEQREKLLQWMRSTVMPLGDPAGERTAYVIMGTTVNRKSLLMHVLHDRADFKSTIYRALIEEPERMDLWEECRLIYIDRENTNRAEDARAFYVRRKDEMDAGSKVLWNEVQPLWRLMAFRWDNGSLAFQTEYQNNPIDEESMIFNPKHFTYHSDDIEFMTDRYEVALGVDPAMGKQKGDYSAVVVTAMHKESGTINVIDAFGDKINPRQLIDKVTEMVLEYQPTVIAAESVAAQEFIVDELKVALTNVGYPAHTRVKKIYHMSRKELRIEAMLPAIENGTIQFSRSHALLLEQFEGYGQGSHDDLLDALEFCVSATDEQEDKVRTVRRMNRW